MNPQASKRMWPEAGLRKHRFVPPNDGCQKLNIMALLKRSHYNVLQVSITANTHQIKAAYHSLILRCHPDKLQSIPRTNVVKQTAFEETKISDAMSGIDIDDEDVDEACAEICSHERVLHSTVPNEHVNLSTSSHLDEDETSTQRDWDPRIASTTNFHHIQAAYDCLRDPGKRHKYDESLRRSKEEEERKWKASTLVNLSEMECDLCVVDDDDEENTDYDSSSKQNVENGSNSAIYNSSSISSYADIGDKNLQKVYSHPCRCGDMFEIVEDELLALGMISNQLWQCESCSLTIQIRMDCAISE